MGSMKFYYQHKKATAYLLGLLLLASFCYLTKGYSGNEEDVSNESSFSGKKDTATILTFIEEGKKGNLPAIANLFVYPIKRPYPLPPIKDSAEFVQYGKSYSMILSAKYYLKQPLKIGKNGVGEFFFCIITLLKVVLMMVKWLISCINPKKKKTKKTIYHRRDKKPASFVTERYRYPDRDLPIGWFAMDRTTWFIRIRHPSFSIYKQGSDLSALPYFTETESIYRIEGSQANKYFEFENDSLKVELLLTSYSSSSWRIWRRERSDICPALWRGLIKDSIPKNQQLSEWWE